MKKNPKKECGDCRTKFSVWGDKCPHSRQKINRRKK